MRLGSVQRVVVACGLSTLAACALPDDIGDLHRQALALERSAVGALKQIGNDTTRGELQPLREQYEQSARQAREIRERLRERLVAERGARFIETKVAEASQLNDDLLRCHETLQERATEAFRFVELGRGQRSSIDAVWGLVDPRLCFDELAPSWDVLLD